MNGVTVDQQQDCIKLAYTERQGQFLAYIHQYSIVNGCAPAEADMQRFFRSRRRACIRWCLRWNGGA